MAVAAAEAGLPVVLGCRDGDAGRALAERLVARGLRASAASVDVTDLPQVQAAVSHAQDFAGPHLAGIVNNAGVIEPIGMLGQTEPKHWAHTIEINLLGAYHGTYAALPHLAPNGVIVNISSGAALTPLPGWSAYCVSKAGLAMLTRATAFEHGDRVRVYGLQPGMVDTDMQASIRASGVGPVSRVPKATLLSPARVARAVIWLLANAPADLSGAEVDLDTIAKHQSQGQAADPDLH